MNAFPRFSSDTAKEAACLDNPGTSTNIKEPVPGKNPAYFTGPASKDQLVYVNELDMAPEQPPM